MTINQGFEKMKRLLILFILSAFLISTQAYATMQLASVRAAWHDTQKIRLVFEVKGHGDVRLSRLQQPDRILLRFSQVKKGLRFSRKVLNMGWVKRIRTGQDRQGAYLVVIDLQGSARYKYFWLKGKRAGEKRLVVDVLRPTTHLSQRSRKTTAKSSRQTVSSTHAHATAKNPAIRAKQRAIKQEILRLTRRPWADRELIVAIDAGHGGKDPGAIGPGGVREKDVTLALARALKRRIDAEPGMRAVLIRKGDEFIPLYERPKLAKKYNADLFISIHADAFPQDRRVRGGSVYVLSEAGASSVIAKALAQRENGSIFLNVDSSEKASSVLGGLVRQANLKASRKLARAVLREMARKVRVHNLRVQSANFVVLRALEMPSVLIEAAFLSNPYDEKNLRSPRFQKNLTGAIVKGVKRYAAQQARQPRWGENLFVHYRVQPGDTLSEIAQRFGTRVSTLRRLNRLRNVNRLYVGKRLKVPVSEKVLAQL